MKNNMEYNCASCEQFTLTIKSAIGKCKKFNKAVMSADYCQEHSKINEMPEFF